MQVSGRSSGRLRPTRSGTELRIWFLMRVTGVALFVLALAHFSILHFLFDPAEQDVEFITNQRWNQLFWRAFDWLLLMTVLFHGFLGMRTVFNDYLGRWPTIRLVTLSTLYVMALVLFVLGTSVILTLPTPGSR
jgi:succinate dehydrogenase / fumarate reductase membrane anchor subunit